MTAAYFTVMQTRTGWTWTCTHPVCEQAACWATACRLASEAEAIRGARQHQHLAHGGVA